MNVRKMIIGLVVGFAFVIAGVVGVFGLSREGSASAATKSSDTIMAATLASLPNTDGTPQTKPELTTGIVASPDSSGSPYWERYVNGWLHYPNNGGDFNVMPGYRDSAPAGFGVSTLTTNISGAYRWIRIWDNFSVAGVSEFTDEGKAAGAPLVYLGDDTFLTDVDWANTTGLFGNQNRYEAGLVLGRGGYDNRTGIKGNANGDICIGKCY